MTIEEAIAELEIDATNLVGKLASEPVQNTQFTELWQRKLNAIDLAQSALRSQLKREKGCEYCAEQPAKWKIGDKLVSNALQYVEYGDGSTHYVRHKFCPICGKPLTKEN